MKRRPDCASSRSELSRTKPSRAISRRTAINVAPLRTSLALRISASLSSAWSFGPRIHPWVFTNTKTERPYTTIRKVFERALRRANITTGDVTVHSLRHTALSRMIEHGLDDHTVMSISGHSSTRMPERYTHPTVERKRVALETFDSVATNWPQERPKDAGQRK